MQLQNSSICWLHCLVNLICCDLVAQTPPPDFSCFGGSAAAYQYTENPDNYFRFTYGTVGKCVGFVETTCKNGKIQGETYYTNEKQKYGYAVYEYDKNDSCTRQYLYLTQSHGLVMLPNNRAKWDWKPDTLEQETLKTFSQEGDFFTVTEKTFFRKQLWLEAKYYYQKNVLIKVEDSMGFRSKYFYENGKCSKIETSDTLNVLQNYVSYTYLGDSMRIANENHLQEDGKMLLDCRTETIYNKQGEVLTDKSNYLNLSSKTWDSSFGDTFTYDEKGRLLTRCHEDVAPLMEMEPTNKDENKK